MNRPLGNIKEDKSQEKYSELKILNPYISYLFPYQLCIHSRAPTELSEDSRFCDVEVDEEDVEQSPFRVPTDQPSPPWDPPARPAPPAHLATIDDLSCTISLVESSPPPAKTNSGRCSARNRVMEGQNCSTGHGQTCSSGHGQIEDIRDQVELGQNGVEDVECQVEVGEVQGQVKSSNAQLNTKEEQCCSERKSLFRKRMISCKVRLLDGSEYRLQLESKATGRCLHSDVCSYIGLLEVDYFSYTSCDANSGEESSYSIHSFWLSHSKRLQKQLKGSLCDAVGNFLLIFKAKFYPIDPSTLREEFSRYLLCLQVQQDIISGRTPCSFLCYALLGSYIAQSELGDYDPVKHGYSSRYLDDHATSRQPGQASRYLEALRFSPSEDSTNELRDKVAELHRTHRGLSSSEADVQYLRNASKLALYGVHLHSAQDSEGNSVSLGVCSYGLLVYRDLIRIRFFSWPRIIKLTYRAKNFQITVRPLSVSEEVGGESGGGVQNCVSGGSTQETYRLQSYRAMKNLWRLVIDHHAFFRLKEVNPQKRRFLLNRFKVKKSNSFDDTESYRRQKSVDSKQDSSFIRSFSRSLNGPLGLDSNNSGSLPRQPQEGEGGGEGLGRGDEWRDGPEIQRMVSDPGCKPKQQRNGKPTLQRQAPVVCCDGPDRLASFEGSQILPVSCGNQSTLSYTPSRASLRSGSSILRTQTRTVTYRSAPTSSADSGALPAPCAHGSTEGSAADTDESCGHVMNDEDDEFEMFVSAHSHSSRTQTIEMTTYQTEKAGVIETRIEKRILLTPDELNSTNQESINQAVAEALRSMKNVDVDHIQITTCTEHEAD